MFPEPPRCRWWHRLVPDRAPRLGQRRRMFGRRWYLVSHRADIDVTGETSVTVVYQARLPTTRDI